MLRFVILIFYTTSLQAKNNSILSNSFCQHLPDHLPTLEPVITDLIDAGRFGYARSLLLKNRKLFRAYKTKRGTYKKIHFKCPSSATLVGCPKSLTCQDGEWPSCRPTCRIKSCGLLPTLYFQLHSDLSPNMGRVTFESTNKHYNQRSDNVCNEYELSGYNRAACTQKCYSKDFEKLQQIKYTCQCQRSSNSLEKARIMAEEDDLIHWEHFDSPFSHLEVENLPPTCQWYGNGIKYFGNEHLFYC